jgi:MoaA/NifB/PqqE/SkfB family radical SAM enzyme
VQSPRYLQIEPTTRCNFTCGFCCGRYMPQQDMPYERFVAVLDAFPDLEHIELQGEGESLMHPRFLDMVAEARRRDIRVSFISNGSLLNPEPVDRLLELGIDKISISIESPDEDEFREIRGGKLSKVIRNLEHLMAERAQRGLERPVVGMSITVLRSTRHRLHEILALYRRLGLDGGISLQPLQQMDAYAQHYPEQMQAQALDDAQVESIWHAFFSDKQVRAVEKSRAPTRGFFDEMMDTWKPATGKCPWLETGLYVDNAGEVSGCCMIKDSARHGFGRVGVDSTESILAKRQALRDELAAGVVPAPCAGCELARYAVMNKSQLVGFGLRGLWARLFGGPARPESNQERLVQLRTDRSR